MPRATASAARRFINDSSAISFRMIICGPGEIFIVAVWRSSWNSVALAACVSVLGSPFGAPCYFAGFSYSPARRCNVARAAHGTQWYMQEHSGGFFPSGQKEIAMDQKWSDVRNRAGKREFLSRTGEKKRKTAWSSSRKFGANAEVWEAAGLPPIGDDTFVSRTRVNDGSSWPCRGM